MDDTLPPVHDIDPVVRGTKENPYGNFPCIIKIIHYAVVVPWLPQKLFSCTINIGF